MKKMQKRRSLKPIAALLVTIIVVSGFFIWLDKAYDRLETNYLARNPNLIYPAQMREDFLDVINNVSYFKNAEDTLYVSGGFEKWFSITGYKDDVGPNLRFWPANACITFSNYFSEQDVGSMLGDLDKLGFSPDYNETRDEIVKKLSGEKTESENIIIAPYQYFERNDRQLRVISPFKTSDRTTTGFACLSEK